MSETEQAKPSIGAEIPYRRNQIEKKTGSLVFDQHLRQTLSDVPEPSADQGASKDGNPIKRGRLN